MLKSIILREKRIFTFTGQKFPLDFFFSYEKAMIQIIIFPTI